MIATEDILCLVENTSIRGEDELEIEEETFYYLQTFIVTFTRSNRRTEVESRQLDAEEQSNVNRLIRSRKGRK